MHVKTTGKSASKTKQTSSLRKNILSLAIIQVLACGSAPLYATNIIVDSAADVVTNDGNCTLREAIQSANSGSAVDNCPAGVGDDTISFDNALSGSTITLGGSELTITRNLTIDGDLDNNGAPDITVDAANASRVFIIIPAGSSRSVILEGLTISGGNATTGGGIFCQTTNLNKYCNVTVSNSIVTGNNATNNGGGIAGQDDSVFTLTNSTVPNNTAGGDGGGIHLISNSDLTLANSTVSGNTATGKAGGIYSGNGDITLVDSTVSGNTATDSGGGIYNYNGDLTVTNSTISGNNSSDRGGGIYSYNGPTTLTSSTVSGNVAANTGGGIKSYGGGLTITNSTISGNNSTGDYGGAIYFTHDGLDITNSTITDNSGVNYAVYVDSSSSFNVVNSILANNTSVGCSVATSVLTSSNNLVTDNSCSISTVSTADPQLGALADNGGPTFTHMPMVGSPVLDAGDNTNCGVGKTVTTDQRGATRDDGSCDLGAVEYTASSLQWDSATALVAESDGSLTLTVSRSGSSHGEVSVDYTTAINTATSPDDFTSSTGTLNFATGITSQTVTITITDDSSNESDEAFSVTLSNAQVVSDADSISLGTNAVSNVTITDDDAVASGGSSSGGAIGWWFMFIPMVMWLRRKVK